MAEGGGGGGVGGGGGAVPTVSSLYPFKEWCLRSPAVAEGSGRQGRR